MEISPDLKYLEGKIEYGHEVERMWKAEDYDSILRALCHELCHLITAEMADPFADKRTGRLQSKQDEYFEERVTETVSRLGYRLYLQYIKERKLCATTKIRR